MVIAFRGTYKVRGYPPGHRLYKPKTFAAPATQSLPHQWSFSNSGHQSHLEHGTGTPTFAPISNPQFTAEQQHQLLQLLHKHNLETTSITKENASPLGLLAGNVVCLLSFIAKDTWTIDSGASAHIIPHLSLLHSSQTIRQPCFITMPNGQQAKITRIGSVLFSPDIQLQDVLCVLEFQLNLISASKLTKQLGSHIVFTPDACLVQGTNT